MDALELLSVLDIVKNEEVYTKRLNQLKEAQDKLADLNEIADTIEVARQKLEEAEEQKALYDKKMLKSGVEIEKEKEKRLEAVLKHEAALTERDKVLAAKEVTIELKMRNLIDSEERIRMRIEQVAKELMAIQEREKAASAALELYTVKVSKLREMING
jgi:hypothetical protein